MHRKPVYWMGSSLDDLSAFPDEVKQVMGFALHLAQTGQRHRLARRMKGNLRAVLEVVDHFGSDSYRTMYTIRPHAIYCLHAFKKKSKKGVSTPQYELTLIARRLRDIETYEKEQKEN